MCGFLLEMGDPRAFGHRALEGLARRGPDGRGFWTDRGIVVGQTRLSIVGLDDRSLAPIENDTHVLAFNGEIYNFLALARALGIPDAVSDTRVLLEAWTQLGPAVLERLEGFWSLAVFDKKARRLTLARDPMGVKPLYLANRDGTLIAGSTFGAVVDRLDARPSLNFRALSDWARYQIVLDPTATFFEGVFKLAPGVCVSSEHDGLLTSSSAIDAWAPAGDRELSDAWVLEAREVLARSIDAAATSDRPVTSTCSGGLDSSLVTRLLAPEVAYQANFSDPECNETKWAKAALEGSATRLLVVNARERFDLVERLDSLVEDFDELTVGSVILPLEDLFAQVSRRYKVCLLGTGGDELFGGYPRYAMALGRCPQESYRGAFERLTEGDVAGNFEALHRKGDPSLFAFADHPMGGEGSRLRFHAALGEDPDYAALLHFDRRHFLPALLNIDDKIAGRFGLEGRPALLHPAFVRKALELRPVLYDHAKEPLRRIARGILPDVVVDRRDKMGFTTPVGTFVAASASRIRESLSGSRFRDLYNLRRVRFSTDSKWSREVFGLALLDAWLRRYA